MCCVWRSRVISWPRVGRSKESDRLLSVGFISLSFFLVISYCVFFVYLLLLGLLLELTHTYTHTQIHSRTYLQHEKNWISITATKRETNHNNNNGKSKSVIVERFILSYALCCISIFVHNLVFKRISLGANLLHKWNKRKKSGCRKVSVLHQNGLCYAGE